MNLKTRIEKLEIISAPEETHREKLERESREMDEGLHDAASTILRSMHPAHQLLVLRELREYNELQRASFDGFKCSLLTFHVHHVALQSWLGRPANLTMPPALAELWLRRGKETDHEAWHGHDREICVDCFAEHPYQRAIEWSAQNPVAAKRYAERCALCAGELIDTFLYEVKDH